MNRFTRWLRLRVGPPKMRYLAREFGRRPFVLLDVGCGNHSASYINRFFPSCRYHGLDVSRYYKNDQCDFECMEAFYEVDLNSLDYRVVPDAFFDAIVLAHVIEHLPEGELVLEALAPKLKVGGVLYVECPHPRSLAFPSMRDTLNFYDDSTHVRMYTQMELRACFQGAGLASVSGGTRFNLWYALLSPVLIPWHAWRRGYVSGPDFWDLLGFAQFVLGRRRY
jgi:trans-aconitate methyltransferase